MQAENIDHPFVRVELSENQGGPPEVITLNLIEGEEVVFGIDGRDGGTGLPQY